MAGDPKALLEVLKKLNDVLQKNVKTLEAGGAKIPGEIPKDAVEITREGINEVYVQVIFLKVS